MSSSSSSRRVPWHAVLIAVLTLGLLWLFVHNIDPHEAWDAMRHARLSFIGLGVLVTLQTYVFRAWRWQVLLRSLGPVRFRTAFRTTVIGFTATFLLPARIGEVLKPYLLARQEGLNPASTFATVIVERLLDLVTVLLMFGLAIPIVGAGVGPEVRAAGGVAAVAAVVSIGVLMFLAGHPARLTAIVERLARRLPAKVSAALSHLTRTFVEGLRVLRRPSHLLVAFAWSIPLWVSIALGIWLCTLAFGLSMPFLGSFLVTGYLAVGVAAPTPGGAGGFHLAYQLAMTQAFAAPVSAAAAAAIVLHVVSFVPVTLVGLVYMWQDGLTLGGLKKMKKEAEIAEELP